MSFLLLLHTYNIASFCSWWVITPTTVASNVCKTYNALKDFLYSNIYKNTHWNKTLVNELESASGFLQIKFRHLKSFEKLEPEVKCPYRILWLNCIIRNKIKYKRLPVNVNISLQLWPHCMWLSYSSISLAGSTNSQISLSYQLLWSEQQN